MLIFKIIKETLPHSQGLRGACTVVGAFSPFLLLRTPFQLRKLKLGEEL